MEKIAIITDSACDIDLDLKKESDIYVLPFMIIYKNKEYIDKIEITPEEIYANMKYEIPKSSLPSIQSMDLTYQKLSKENYTHVIALMISSGLSGASNALRLVGEQYPEIKTFIYDTKSTSICEGVLVKQCMEAIRQGRAYHEIIASIAKWKQKLHFFFVFGTLEYARKGGRIGRVSGAIGDILDIKPIVGFDEEYGQCYTYSKIRGRNKSLHKLADLGIELAAGKRCDAYIVHGNSIEGAMKVYEKLKMTQGIETVTLVGQISAVVGVYCGPGTVGVCYVERD